MGPKSTSRAELEYWRELEALSGPGVSTSNRARTDENIGLRMTRWRQ